VADLAVVIQNRGAVSLPIAVFMENTKNITTKITISLENSTHNVV
jgi:hypothetical protein